MLNEVSVDGIVTKEGFSLIGNAIQWEDYTWTCLANCNGALCRIQIKLTGLPNG